MKALKQLGQFAIYLVVVVGFIVIIKALFEWGL